MAFPEPPWAMLIAPADAPDTPVPSAKVIPSKVTSVWLPKFNKDVFPFPLNTVSYLSVSRMEMSVPVLAGS